MLTANQKRLLNYMMKTVSETGVMPSYDEMAKGLGLSSKSGIHRMILALEERGFTRRLPFKARALEVTDKATSVLPERITDADVLLSKIAAVSGAVDALPRDIADALIDYVEEVAA